MGALVLTEGVMTMTKSTPSLADAGPVFDELRASQELFKSPFTEMKMEGSEAVIVGANITTHVPLKSTATRMREMIRLACEDAPHFAVKRAGTLTYHRAETIENESIGADSIVLFFPSVMKNWRQGQNPLDHTGILIQKAASYVLNPINQDDESQQAIVVKGADIIRVICHWIRSDINFEVMTVKLAASFEK